MDTPGLQFGYQYARVILVLVFLLAVPISSLAQTRSTLEGSPDAVERARQILENQPDFQATVIVDSPGASPRHPNPLSVAKRGKAYRFELAHPGSGTNDVILVQPNGDAIHLFPAQRRYLVGHDFDSQALIATWLFGRDLLRDPNWIVDVTGDMEMDAHPCTLIRATYKGSDPRDEVILYAAADLRGLVIRVESRGPRQQPCDRPAPRSYHLTTMALNAPSALFRRPRGYKPIEIYDPPPPCSGIDPDGADVAVGDDIRLRAAANDPGDGSLRYSWTSSGGKITGSCAVAVLSTDGMLPGTYTVTVQIDDGRGHTVDCSTSVHVHGRALPGSAPN